MNFDNIIIKNSNLYLIDYEWKAPIDFSRLSITRALYYFFLTNQQIILSNYQLQPGIKITKNLVVPEIFYNLTNRYLGIDDIDRFIEFEKQIQSHVGTKNLNQDKVKDSERIIIPKYYSLTEQLVISVEENVRLKSEKTDILNKLSI
ncbi:MAG: hypothetical protein KDH96_09625, partial [Candidatus Riesia sp.]|nr:hypothetical protein [Candidatus Riesia sp.]